LCVEKPWDDGGSEVVEYIVERSISGGLFQEIYHGDDVSLPISSLFPGMQYHFRVAAVNSIGKGKFSHSCQCITLPVVPNQCNAPVVSGRVKPQSVQLNWTPPDYDGGSPIMQYAVKQITTNPSEEEEESGGDEISRDHRCDLIVFELVPGTLYGFSVCAINSVGPGPWSPVLQVRTAADKPCAPEAPRVVFKSATHAKISWSVPKLSNGSKVAEYRLECCEIRRPNPFVKFDVCNAIVGSKLVDEETAAMHQELMSSAYYTTSPSPSSLGSHSVVATSSKRPNSSKSGGSGDPAYSSSSTSRYGSNYATYNDGNSASGSSASGTGEKRNRGLSKNTALPNGPSNPPQNVTFFQLYTGPKISFDYNSMKPATDYVFRVQACNEVGPSAFSAETAISSPCSHPEKVEEITAETGADWVSLKWSEPGCNGASVMSYNIECARMNKRMAPVIVGVNSPLEFPDEKNAHIVAYCCEDNSYSICNLKSDTDYMLRVQATNDNGNGPFSVPIKIHTTSLPPDPPQLECVNATSSSLKLRWTELSCSKDLKYHLQIEGNASRSKFVTTYTGAAVSYKVIKLQELSSYTFRINASNDAGSGPFSPLYSFTTTKSAPPPMKAPKMRICRDTGCAEISWAAVPAYQEDKVLYQLMVAFAPASSDYMQVYKGEETFVDVEQIVMLAASRPQQQQQHQSNKSGSNNNTSSSILDLRLKVCALRHCLDDDQLIAGQYSPISSFLYSLDSHNASTSNNGVNQTLNGQNAASSSALSRFSATGTSSFWSTTSQNNHKEVPTVTTTKSIVVGKSNCQLRSNSANWIELDASASCIANDVATIHAQSLSDSSDGSEGSSTSATPSMLTVIGNKVREAKTAVVNYQPSDKQIAAIFLSCFFVVAVLLAVYVQHLFV